MLHSSFQNSSSDPRTTMFGEPDRDSEFKLVKGFILALRDRAELFPLCEYGEVARSGVMNQLLGLSYSFDGGFTELEILCPLKSETVEIDDVECEWDLWIGVVTLSNGLTSLSAAS